MERLSNGQEGPAEMHHQILTAPAAKKKAEERFDVLLTDFGRRVAGMTVSRHQYAVIKVVQEITGLRLRETKELFNNLPVIVIVGASKSDVEEVLKKLERVGAKAKLVLRGLDRQR